MANSFKRYTGDGSTTDFSVTFPYLDKAHVGVKVDGSSASFTWFNDTTVRMDTAPANGSVVEVRRTTPVQRIVDFQDGAVIIEENLDDSAQQALYLSEEASDDSLDALRDDGANNWDGQSKRLTNIADPTSAQDVATKNFAETGMNSQLIRAEAEADDAATSATNAATSETNAASSASAASTSASNAATYETGAQSARDKAEDWADEAEDVAVETGQYSAKHHAAKASDSATAAATYETGASNSASAASTSETNAAASESAAATSESNARSSELAAASSESDAASSASAASTSESNAATSASNASTSETNASNSATEASNWAQYAEDSPVPQGNGSEYSAYHWAQKAEDNASTTAANVSYDNSGSGLVATDVKAALDELDAGGGGGGGGLGWTLVSTFYDSATDGTLASVETPNFADGYQYRISLDGVAPDVDSFTFLDIEFYKETDAAYTSAKSYASTSKSSDPVTGHGFLPFVRSSEEMQYIEGQYIRDSGTDFPVATMFLMTAQKITKARISYRAQSIASGTMKLYRRAV